MTWAALLKEFDESMREARTSAASAVCDSRADNYCGLAFGIAAATVVTPFAAGAGAALDLHAIGNDVIAAVTQESEFAPEDELPEIQLFKSLQQF
jgi:hypothetical protein